MHDLHQGHDMGQAEADGSPTQAGMVAGHIFNRLWTGGTGVAGWGCNGGGWKRVFSHSISLSPSLSLSLSLSLSADTVCEGEARETDRGRQGQREGERGRGAERQGEQEGRLNNSELTGTSSHLKPMVQKDFLTAKQLSGINCLHG